LDGTAKEHRINYPKQQRSLVRYNYILDVAATLFASEGYENVGTNHIAAQAGVSVGSFYRFFSDKEALVTALVERYINRLDESLPQVTDTSVPMATVVEAMLTGVLEFDRHNASFAQILTTTQAGQLANAAITIHLTLKGWVEQMLKLYFPSVQPDAIHLCAASGMGIVKGMLTMTQPPDLIPFEVVLEEMVVTLMAYVEAFMRKHAS
jgi:AcrR family transcriptional regulator